MEGPKVDENRRHKPAGDSDRTDAGPKIDVEVGSIPGQLTCQPGCLIEVMWVETCRAGCIHQARICLTETRSTRGQRRKPAVVRNISSQLHEGDGWRRPKYGANKSTHGPTAVETPKKPISCEHLLNPHWHNSSRVPGRSFLLRLLL